MKFQNLDELYTYLRDKLVQKAEEKPRLIWRLRRIIEDDSAMAKMKSELVVREDEVEQIFLSYFE